MNKLEDMLKIAEIHVARIDLAMLELKDVFPLSEARVVAFSQHEVAYTELLTNRFAKLQDYIGRILINEVLKNAGDYDESLTMVDKINKLERLKIIESAEL
jgi:hypothetical protein